jgi:hypothetical protein
VFSALYMTFALVGFVGVLLLVIDAAWYLRYRSAAIELTRYANGFPLKICPACKGELHLIENVTHHLFIPSVSRTVGCNHCVSRLVEIGPDAWKYFVDGARSPQIEWLYDGEVLDIRELNGILAGQHTPRAQAKITNRIEQERKTARRNALNTISNGNLAVLDRLESRLIETPSGVQTFWGKGINPPAELKLQKNEVCLLVMRPITFGEERTKDNVPYIKTVERGEFFITDRRYGFIGSTKTVTQKLDAITRIGTRQGALLVARTNRKTPEFFINIDNELAEAVLTGVRSVQ